MQQEAPEDILFLYNEPLYSGIEGIDDASMPLSAEGARILILFNQDDLNEETAPMLKKMMAGCRFEEKDYHLSAVSAGQDILPLLRAYHPACCLLFGLPLQSEFLRVNKQPNKPFRFGGIAFLQSETLTRIARSPELKSTLWTQGLKVLFGL